MRKKWAIGATSLTLTLALGISGCTAGDPDSDPGSIELEEGPLTVGIWGGVWEDAINAVIPEFTAETGAEVILDISNSADRVSLLQAGQGSGMDVAFLTPEAMIQAQMSGVLASFTEAEVPNLATTQPVLTDNFADGDGFYAAPISWTSTGILYREDLVPFEITGIEDLWDPALEGRIAIQNMPTLGAASFLVQASSVFGEGPDDIDAGFAALAELRPNIQQFYSVSSDALAALVAGDLWVVSTIANQGVGLADQGVVTILPEEGIAYSIQAAAVTAGADKPNLAQAFVDYLLRPDVQAVWSEAGQTGPSGVDVALSAAAQANIAETPDTVENLVDLDFPFIAENLQTWTERWQREVAN